MNRLTMPTVVAAAAILAVLGAPPWALAFQGNGNSAASITGSYADSCRDFTAHSSKDISHVELHYASGSVVKDESITSPDWAIDGGPGEEIDFAYVKSGTTTEEFACEPSNAAPTALLEIQTPPVEQTLETCYDFFAGGLDCEQSSPRTAWTGTAQIPDNGGNQSGFFTWGCGFFTPHSECPLTISFRGIGSSDPDDDIASWSLDFGDGTSVSGTWSSPPAQVAHEYGGFGDTCIGAPQGIPGVCLLTLTVTDSAGQSDSETIPMVFVDQTPD
jgi:hypothetical protein